MTCPRCGYACSEFDIYCLRCSLLAARGRARQSVEAAEQTVIMSAPLLDPSPAAGRFSTAWVFALLAVLGLLAGFILWHVSATPNPPPQSHLSVSAGSSLFTSS